MTELERPIKELLREPRVPVDALWRRIERARERPLRAARVPSFVLALGGAFALALVVAVYAPSRLPWSTPSSASRDQGPLRRAGGDVLGVLDTSDGASALDVALSDGSYIHLDPGAKLATRASNGKTYRAEVMRGSVLFEVKTHGPRRWIIDAADTRVEVLGTRFVVEHRPADSGAPSEARVRVAVERGRLSVRGPRVSGGLQVLSAGEQLQLVVQPPAASPPAEPVAPEPMPEPNAIPQPAPPSIDDLLRDADLARAERDYARAERLLRRALREHGRDPQASLVALTLGRLQLDQLNAPKAAAASLARADRLGLPAAVAEEGAARLVEAHARAGEQALARDAAARYRRRFPNGPRSASVAAWVAPD